MARLLRTVVDTIFVVSFAVVISQTGAAQQVPAVAEAPAAPRVWNMDVAHSDLYKKSQGSAPLAAAELHEIKKGFNNGFVGAMLSIPYADQYISPDAVFGDDVYMNGDKRAIVRGGNAVMRFGKRKLGRGGNAFLRFG